jgi:hypothetical protein
LYGSKNKAVVALVQKMRRFLLLYKERGGFYVSTKNEAIVTLVQKNEAVFTFVKRARRLLR